MKTLVIETRNATPQDANGILEVFQKTWRQTYQGLIPHKSLEALLAERNEAWWKTIAEKSRGGICVLEHGGKIVGYSTQGAARRKDLSFPAEIFELYILPEYQGIGLGRDLFMNAAQRLLNVNHPRFHVWMMTENHLGCKFMERMGGQIIARGAQPFGETKLPLQAYGFIARKI